MKEFKLNITLTARDEKEAEQVKGAFQTMIRNFKAEGIIKMEKIFKTDAFIRNMVKMKLKVK